MKATTVVTSLLALVAPAAAVSRGLPWAVDNRFAPTLGNLKLINWYYHWADPVVPEMPDKVQFVPMYWGPKNRGKWETVKNYIDKHFPEYLLAFNEPDLDSQANMDPAYAADEFVRELLPYGKKGVKLGSPAIAFDIDWLEDFLKELEKRGGWVNFVACHWYGKHDRIEDFKRQISQVHQRTGRDIWVTEVGLGADGGYQPTEGQAQEFMSAAFSWMDSQPYIKRAAWFGAFQKDNTPDAFGKPANAFFKSGNSPQLTNLAYWYGNNGPASGNEHNDAPKPPKDDNKGDDNKDDDKKDDDKDATPTKDAAKPAATKKPRKCKRAHVPGGKNSSSPSAKLQSRHSRIKALLNKRHH